MNTNQANCEDLFQTIGQIFDPAGYNFVESGFAAAKQRNIHHHKEEVEEAVYDDYSIDELVECIREQLDRAEVGQKIYVDMGIAILTAKVVLDHEEADPGDYFTPPYTEQYYRLEGVQIVEEDGRHRRLEEIAVSKMIF